MTICPSGNEQREETKGGRKRGTKKTATDQWETEKYASFSYFKPQYIFFTYNFETDRVNEASRDVDDKVNMAGIQIEAFSRETANFELSCFHQ